MHALTNEHSSSSSVSPVEFPSKTTLYRHPSYPANLLFFFFNAESETHNQRVHVTDVSPQTETIHVPKTPHTDVPK